MNKEAIQQLTILLNQRDMSVEEKISYLIVRKRFETFYITELDRDKNKGFKNEQELFFVEVYHKNTFPSRTAQHGLIPDSHIQFKGLYTLKNIANKLKYHKGEGER